MAKMKNLGGEVPTNDAEELISMSEPYVARISIKGTADLIFHRWSVDSVDQKAKASKNSKEKKTDNIESYVYRNEKGEISIPGEYLRMCLINAARFRQDPRSPRKSAMDLYKAALIPLTKLASLGVKNWDYEDRRRCVIQRNAINRTRPAMQAGWEAIFDMQVLLPEYIGPDTLHETLILAGKLIGIADFRPTYGRFLVSKFEILTESKSRCA